MARITKPSEEIVVCVESFSTSYSGTPRLVKAGDRLRADDEVVRKLSQFFVDADATTAEIAQARQEIYAENGVAAP
jgi:hypothetical protein